MAVNAISLNSVQANTVSTFHLPYFSEDSRIDILYHLGTDLQTVSYSEPNGSTVSITNTAGTISNGIIAQLINRNSDTVEWSTSTCTVQIEFLTNYEVDISTYEIRNGGAAASNYWNSWIFEASNDAVTWTEIDRRSNVGPAPANFDYEPYNCDNRFGFFKYVRWRVLDIVGTGLVADLYLYGKVRNLTTGVAGTKGAIGTMAQFPDIDAARTSSDQRIFIYDGTTWELRANVPWVVLKRVLTEDLVIESGYEPTFYVISPNGAARDVYLPSPNIRDTIRIKNLDGAFDLSVYEFDVTILNSGLTNYFQLEELSGNDRQDSVGSVVLQESGGTVNADTGIISNGASFIVSENDILSTSLGFDIVGTFTLSAWVYLANKPAHPQIIVANYDPGNGDRAFQLYWDDATDKFVWQTSQDGSTVVGVVGTTTPSTSTWYHLVATYDSTNGDIALYVNGVEEDTNSHNNAASTDANDARLTVGGRRNAGAISSTTILDDGRVDEFGIWNRVLSESEITTLYNGGSAQSYATISGTPPTPIVLNNAGKLQYEFVYDGTEWIVTG